MVLIVAITKINLFINGNAYVEQYVRDHVYHGPPFPILLS